MNQVAMEVVVMAKTEVPIPDRISAPRRAEGPGAPRLMPAVKDRKRHVPVFWRHFLQMLAAMVVGMVATSAVFRTVVGLKTWGEVTVQYPTQSLLAMAAGMTIPMVAWMLYRGMGRRNSSEMAAAMLVPVVPFLCLVWFNVTESALCGAYCVSTVVTMLALMFYRRNEYSLEVQQGDR